jgi:hypothetical protein
MTSDFISVMEEVSGGLDAFFAVLYHHASQILNHNPPFTKKEGNHSGAEQDYLSGSLELLIVSQKGSQTERLLISRRVTAISVRAQEVKEIIPDPETNLYSGR